MNRMKLNSETITLLAIKDISNELNEKESESWNKLTRVLTHEIMNTNLTYCLLCLKHFHCAPVRTESNTRTWSDS